MKQEYNKYTFREFLSLEAEEMDEYKSVGMLMKPDSWGVSDVMNWPYVTVKDIQVMLSEDVNYEQIIDIITKLTGMRIDKILDKPWNDVFKFVKFVFKSIEQVNEVEKKLAYKPEPDEEQAGIEMYNQFGYFATIDRLAGGDPLKYDEIGQTEFSVIFAKLMLNSVDTQFSKNYQKIIMKK